MIKTYAARILLDHTPFVEVPLFVDFYPEKSNDEITYVRLKTSQNAARKNSEFIASIPVYHPAGVIIDDHNWAGFLYLYLYQRDKMRQDFNHLESVRGCRYVQSYPSFGCYCFVIESQFDLYGIVIDRPSGSPRPARLINQATIIKSPYSNYDGSGVYYDDHGLILKKERASRIIRPHHDVYHISFKRPLLGPEILSIYLDGVNKLNITDKMLHKATDEWELQLHSIGDFEYFKSIDKKVIFTLHKDPVKKAIRALMNMLPQLVDNKDLDKVSQLQEDYQSLMYYYICQEDTKEEKADILLRCIEKLEYYQINQ